MTDQENNVQDNKIQEIVTDMDPGAMVTKYIFLAEGMDNDGKRAMYSGATKGLSVWDEMGLLEFGKTLCLQKMLGLER